MEKAAAEKLQAKSGSAVFVGTDDPALRTIVEPLPDGARLVDAPSGSEVCVFFVRDRAELDIVLERHLSELAGVRAPWIAYRKGGRSDINRDSIWARLAEVGWRLNSNVSLTDEWSAVRLRRS